MAIKYTLSEKIYQRLKSDLVQGKFEPGSELNESYLAEYYKVSRTPIRDALKKLETDRLVKIIPHKGAIVAEPSLKDIIEINELREMLEGLGARLAAREQDNRKFQVLRSKFPEPTDDLTTSEYENTYKLGEEMHSLILKTAKNGRLTQMLNDIQIQVDIIMKINAEIPGRSRDAIIEHTGIIEAIIEHNEDLAEMRMREHIRKVSMSMVNYYGRVFY